MATLFRQDLANVELGIYPLPFDHDGSLTTLLTTPAFSSRTSPKYTAVVSVASIAKF